MKIPALPVLGAVSVLVLSACGGTSSSASADSRTPSAAGAAGHASGQSLHVANTSLGKVVVDGAGMTVYTLSADGAGTSTCASSCLTEWPAVPPGKGDGVSGKIDATTTPDGAPIATVAGHPVYTFAGDEAPGDVNGEGLQDFGGVWYAVSPTGAAVTG
jgi:predicted lipoprotein with Yx(FWY)xxD motif